MYNSGAGEGLFSETASLYIGKLHWTKAEIMNNKNLDYWSLWKIQCLPIMVGVPHY
jgi:hypothetical protein